MQSCVSDGRTSAIGTSAQALRAAGGLKAGTPAAMCKAREVLVSRPMSSGRFSGAVDPPDSGPSEAYFALPVFLIFFSARVWHGCSNFLAELVWRRFGKRVAKTARADQGKAIGAMHKQTMALRGVSRASRLLAISGPKNSRQGALSRTTGNNTVTVDSSNACATRRPDGTLSRSTRPRWRSSPVVSGPYRVDVPRQGQPLERHLPRPR